MGVTILLENYRYIGVTEGVCGGRPIIVGTRIEPSHIANYGTINDITRDFDLTREQVKEAFSFMLKKDMSELLQPLPDILIHKERGE